MYRKIHIVLFVLTLGCLTAPQMAFACGSNVEKSENSCCKKESEKKSTKKCCCAKDKCSKDKDGKGCNDNCGNSGCGCPSINFSTILPFVSDIRINNFSPELENQKYSSLNTYQSKGFLFLWLRPKVK